MKLSRSFFTQPSLIVAKKLLGKYIVRKIGKKTLIGKIVETEAYPGPYDRASHAYRGRRTARTEVEWKEGGYVYIYLVYGMYWQLNITTGKKDYPECVLIRALEPRFSNSLELKHKKPHESFANIRDKNSRWISDAKLANGPGKLCNYLKLDKSFYGEDVTKSTRLWLTEGDRISKKYIAHGSRINIDYAGTHYASRPWRFWIRHNPSVSR
jgi:DNA-3-methyladenine glycosylase